MLALLFMPTVTAFSICFSITIYNSHALQRISANCCLRLHDSAIDMFMEHLLGTNPETRMSQVE